MNKPKLGEPSKENLAQNYDDKSHSRIKVSLLKKTTEECRKARFRLELEDFIDSNEIFKEKGISALVRMNFYRHLTARSKDDDAENALFEYLHELRTQQEVRSTVASLIFDELIGFVKNCIYKDENLFLIFCFMNEIKDDSAEVVEGKVIDKKSLGVRYSIINERLPKKK